MNERWNGLRTAGSVPQMHPDQVPTSTALVRRLVAEQMPAWERLEVTALGEFGTDHALYRLGPDLLVRLPIIGWAVDQVASDWRWMPVLAPRLPASLPRPVAVGAPGHGYPFPWLVVEWLPGRPPVEGRVSVALASDLATFVAALHAADTTGGPTKRPDDRGGSLAARDRATRCALLDAADQLDVRRALAVWDDALGADPWGGPPVWVHGDLLAGNLLEQDGRLSAVIDFGALGLGDPAVDLTPAWGLLDGRGRSRFCADLAYDSHAWRRSRGWALTTAVMALGYYRDSVPAFLARSQRTIARLTGP